MELTFILVHCSRNPSIMLAGTSEHIYLHHIELAVEPYHWLLVFFDNSGGFLWYFVSCLIYHVASLSVHIIDFIMKVSYPEIYLPGILSCPFLTVLHNVKNAQNNISVILHIFGYVHSIVLGGNGRGRYMVIHVLAHSHLLLSPFTHFHTCMGCTCRFSGYYFAIYILVTSGAQRTLCTTFQKQ